MTHPLILSLALFLPLFSSSFLFIIFNSVSPGRNAMKQRYAQLTFHIIDRRQYSNLTSFFPALQQGLPRLLVSRYAILLSLWPPSLLLPLSRVAKQNLQLTANAAMRRNLLLSLLLRYNSVSVVTVAATPPLPLRHRHFLATVTSGEAPLI